MLSKSNARSCSRDARSFFLLLMNLQDGLLGHEAFWTAPCHPSVSAADDPDLHEVGNAETCVIVHVFHVLGCLCPQVALHVPRVLRDRCVCDNVVVFAVHHEGCRVSQMTWHELEAR